MNDPVRLCDGDDLAAKRLLSAMREERAPSGAAQRALVALGVAGAVTTTAAVAGASKSSALWLAALKWLGGGVVLGLAVGGGASLVESRAPEPATVPVVVAPAERPVAAPSPRSEPEVIEPVPVVRSPRRAPAVEPEVVEPALAPTASFAAPGPDALAREIELLDRARQALARGDGQSALAALDRHASEHPRARLSAEAFVVRLRALTRVGRTSEARALAEAHLRAQPSSPHAKQIREITGLGAAP
jgi:hypothetical protein